MADIRKPLTATPASLSASAATIYTAPAAGTVVLFMLFTNVTAAERLVTMSIGADATGTRIIYQLPIPVGDPVPFPCYIVLSNAQIVQAFCDSAAGVNVQMSGIEQ